MKTGLGLGLWPLRLKTETRPDFQSLRLTKRRIQGGGGCCRPWCCGGRNHELQCGNGCHVAKICEGLGELDSVSSLPFTLITPKSLTSDDNECSIVVVVAGT